MNTKKLFPITLSLGAGLALAVAGCGKNDEPTAQDYDDIASSTAALVSDEPTGEAESADDVIMATTDQLPNGMTRHAGGILSGRRGEVEFEFDLDCADASGAAQETCQGASSAHLVASWTGSLQTARREVSVVRNGDWTLTDLQTPVVELNGAGSLHVEGSFAAIARPETRTYIYDYAGTYEGVKIDRAARKFTGGKITYEIDAQKTIDRARRDVERTFHVLAEVEFTANGRARIVLDKSRTYEVTLAGGAVAPTGE